MESKPKEGLSLDDMIKSVKSFDGSPKKKSYNKDFKTFGKRSKSKSSKKFSPKP